MATYKAVVYVAAYITTTPQRPNWLQCGEDVSVLLRGYWSARRHFLGHNFEEESVFKSMSVYLE